MEDQKKCSGCGQWLNTERFSRDSRAKDGLGYTCKVCDSIANKKSRKAIQERNNQADKDGVKTCIRCNLSLPLSSFYQNKNRVLGLQDRCSTCDKQGVAARQARYRENGPVLTDTKRCCECHETKPISDFNKQSGGYWGVQAKCRECALAYHQAYYYNLKIEVLGHYSGGTPHCECCRSTYLPVLTIDHINRDGGQRRRERLDHHGQKFWRQLKTRGYPDTYRVLCMNCNLASYWGGNCDCKNYPPLPE